MFCFRSKIESGVLGSMPPQFAVLPLSSFLSQCGLHSIPLPGTLPSRPGHSIRSEVRRDRNGEGQVKGDRKLAVRVTYERSRLSADCLTKAYERLVPVARAHIGVTEHLTEEAARVQPAQRR